MCGRSRAILHVVASLVEELQGHWAHQDMWKEDHSDHGGELCSWLGKRCSCDSRNKKCGYFDAIFVCQLTKL